MPLDHTERKRSRAGTESIERDTPNLLPEYALWIFDPAFPLFREQPKNEFEPPLLEDVPIPQDLVLPG